MGVPPNHPFCVEMFRFKPTIDDQLSPDTHPSLSPSVRQDPVTVTDGGANKR